jgi:hypothetical protein
LTEIEKECTVYFTMAHHEVVIPQLETNPELTEADTMAALAEMRAWYDEYALPDTLRLQTAYGEQESRYRAAVADVLDVVCTDGVMTSREDMMSKRYTMAARRLDADITDDRFDFLTTVSAVFVPVHKRGWTHWDDSIDYVKHAVHSEWKDEVRYLPGDELAVFSLQTTRHPLAAVGTHRGASGIKLTHNWDGGQQLYLADEDPTETIKLERLQRWDETKGAAFRALRDEKASEILREAEYGQLLHEATKFDRGSPVNVVGDYRDYRAAIDRVSRPGSWDREEISDRIQELAWSLSYIRADKVYPGLAGVLMRPDVIQTARIALAYSESYMSSLPTPKREMLTKRLEWVLYYAPRLQYDTYCLMAADGQRRSEINQAAIEPVRARADTAEALYNQVLRDTIQIDPAYWQVEQSQQAYH